MQATMDSTMEMIQVFEAVRNNKGEIIDFKWVLNNHAAEKIYGEVVGKSLLQNNPGVVNEGIFDTLKKVTETGVPDQSERHYVHEHFNGWFHQSVVKLDDGVVTTTTNITEHKKAQHELQQTKDLLQDIINAPNIGIAVYKALRNNKGEIINFLHEYINRPSVAMLGEDFTGKLFTDHGENAITQMPQFIQVIETGKGNSYIREAVFQGCKVWFAITNTPLDRDRLVHTWEDITKRRDTDEEILSLKDEIAQKATDKYYSIFNSIDEGFCIYEIVYDLDGQPVDLRWIEVNPAYEKHTGLKDVVGKSHSDLSLATEKYWLDIYDKIAKTGEAVHFENWHEPTHRWYHVFASKIGEAESRQVAVVFTNITEQKQAEQRQEYLLKLNDAIRSTADPIEIEEKVTTVAMEYFAADRCYYNTIEGDQSIIRRDARKEGLPSVAGSYPLNSFPLFKKVIDDAVPFVVHNAADTDILDEELRQLCFQLQVISFIDVPVIKNGKAAGILCIVQSIPRKWTQSEINLAVETAERIWAAVERAKAESQLAKELEDTKKLQQISTRIIEEDNVQALYEAILDSAMDIMNAHFASLQVLSPDKKGLHLLAHKNFHPDSAKYWQYVDATTPSACGQVLATGNRVIVSDVENCPFPLEQDDVNAYRLSGIASMQSTPLISRTGTHVGVMSTLWRQPHQPLEHELNLFDVIARQAADLIERNNAQEALRKTQAQLATAFEVMPVALGFVDKEGKLLLANKEMEYYMPAAVIPSKNEEQFKRWMAYDASGQPVERHNYPGARALRGEIVLPGMEMLYTDETGKRKWARVAAVPFLDEKGEIVGATTVISDINELKTNAEALRHLSETLEQQVVERTKELQKHIALLHQAEELAGMGSWEYNLQTTDFTWSEGMYRLFEIPKGSKVPPEVYVQLAAPEDKQKAERLATDIRQGKAHFEETIGMKIGEVVKVLKIQGNTICNQQGAPQQVIGVDIDITAAKEAEQTLSEQAHFIQSINQALPDILFVMNLDSREILYSNHSFQENLNHRALNRSDVGRNFLEMVYEEDLPTVLAHIDTLKADIDDNVYEVEYRIIAPDGRLHWFRDRNAVFKRDKAGRALDKIGIAQDITDRRKAEQDLAESNINLRYANENLQQFASIASHDLQEPLRKLKMFANILTKRHALELSGEAKDLIGKMSTATDRMRQLIKEVLDYSKIAQGLAEFIPTGLDKVMQNVIADLDLLISEKGATIQYQQALPTVKAVPLQMNQLFYNLLTNALKFSKEDVPLVITISSRQLASDEVKQYAQLKEDVPYTEIIVADNGIGFEQQYAEQIFQLFERLHSTDEYEGTGVGLALCKKIVENHFGHIFATASLGQGASFHVILPLIQ